MTDHHFIIDNVAFAKRAEQLSGVIPLSACHRLVDYLNSHSIFERKDDFDRLNHGVGIKFSLRGEEDVLRKCFLHLQIQVELQLICQRCLNQMGMDFSLEIDYLVSDLVLDHAAADDQLDDSDEYDLLEPSQAMDLLSLIEDELILAIPISPKHDFNCTDVSKQSGEKPNPFAVLKDLIKSSNKA